MAHCNFSEQPQMRLELPKSGKIQQGALFNCVQVPGYEGCACHGLILTSRCDLEHGKYSVINYLPVVRFSDWANREMCYLLARRIHKSVQGAINKVLSDKRVTKYVLGTFPLQDIIERETSGKDRENLLVRLGQLCAIEAVLHLEGRLTSRGSELCQIDGKQSDTLIKELIQGKLPEYYFLNAVDINESTPDGYVVLLRSMRILNTEHASKIASGLEKESAQSEPGLMSILTFAHDPICMITGVLRSPDIEHLAQFFASLFIKIGLEDHEDHTVEYHQNIVKR